jgi:hypothetical protein
LAETPSVRVVARGAFVSILVSILDKVKRLGDVR